MSYEDITDRVDELHLGNPHTVVHLIHCMPKVQFDFIKEKKGGIMDPVLYADTRDISGILRYKLKGISFSVHVQGHPESYYILPSTVNRKGKVCIVDVALAEIFTERTNLYLAYTVREFQFKDTHTCLVLTEKGSEQDEICKRILPLSRILRRRVDEDDKLSFETDTHPALLELFYAEPLDIRGKPEVSIKQSDHIDVKPLYDKAEKYCDRAETEQVSFLYRNKKGEYFDHILKKNNGVMETIIKDNGGDPKCPINGELNGVFFGVTLYKSRLPTISPFGDTRVLVQLAEVFKDCTNLYFADFYCMTKNEPKHYIILVLSDQGTWEDDYCKKYLFNLDPLANPFLTRQLYKGELMYETIKKQNLWVEVFYTKSVNITGRQLIKGFETGSSKPGGIPKIASCHVCNVIR